MGKYIRVCALLVHRYRSNCSLYQPSTIKVWDLVRALDQRTPADQLCLNTLSVSSCVSLS